MFIIYFQLVCQSVKQPVNQLMLTIFYWKPAKIHSNCNLWFQYIIIKLIYIKNNLQLQYTIVTLIQSNTNLHFQYSTVQYSYSYTLLPKYS